MASTKEIDLVCEIQRTAIQIAVQGKYLPFTGYSPHVAMFEVYIHHNPYGGEYVEGWSVCDRHVYLSTGYKLSFGEEMQDVVDYKVEQLEKLKADLLEFLDVDADGVPV